MITIFSTRNSWLTKLLGCTTILLIIHTDRQNSLLTDLQDCTTMLTIIHTWNSLLTKLPGEHQPSIPAQRAQVLPQQGKKQSNYIRNISNMSGQRFWAGFISCYLIYILVLGRCCCNHCKRKLQVTGLPQTTLPSNIDIEDNIFSSNQ